MTAAELAVFAASSRADLWRKCKGRYMHASVPRARAPPLPPSSPPALRGSTFFLTPGPCMATPMSLPNHGMRPMSLPNHGTRSPGHRRTLDAGRAVL